jgi:hypothetical protein
LRSINNGSKIKGKIQAKIRTHFDKTCSKTNSAKLVKLTIFYFNSPIKLLTPKKDKKKLLRDFEMMSMFKFIED